MKKYIIPLLLLSTTALGDGLDDPSFYEEDKETYTEENTTHKAPLHPPGFFYDFPVEDYITPPRKYDFIAPPGWKRYEENETYIPKVRDSVDVPELPIGPYILIAMFYRLIRKLK